MNLRKLLFLVLVLTLSLGILPLKAQDGPITMTMWIRDTSFLILDAGRYMERNARKSD